MNIIALFLHILWDRKCSYWFPFQKQTVVLFLLSDGPRFRSPHREASKGELWTHSCTLWVQVQSEDTCTRTALCHTHAQHSQRLSTSSLAPHPNTPSMKRNQLNRSQVQDHIKCTFKNINPTQTRKKKTVTTSGNNNKLLGIPNGW